MTFTNIRKIQIVLMILGVLYLLSLIGFIIYKSLGKQNILLVDLGSLEDGSASNIQSGGLADDNNFAIHLQDFHRTDIKNAVKNWEIEAADAYYDMQSGTTRMRNAKIVIYREDGTVVAIDALSARIIAEKNQVKRVDLEGNIKVKLNNEIMIDSNIATFNEKDGKIITPAKVKLRGPSYEIEGVGLEVEIATDIVVVKNEVRSWFRKSQK
ncbi:MAG: LPS export ABC transporter periplasmic protein LptC [Deltaproteobacteria bacterium]|jgi:LPS export ABC transporter protein LptC|nr:LPS export ABC transporter periplasmic protein LptC [Deltaproteobacteria bacterium]